MGSIRSSCVGLAVPNAGLAFACYHLLMTTLFRGLDQSFRKSQYGLDGTANTETATGMLPSGGLL